MVDLLLQTLGAVAMYIGNSQALVLSDNTGKYQVGDLIAVKA